MNDKKEFMIRCVCWCSVIAFNSFDWDDDTFCISYYPSRENSLWQKVKIAWNILTGKEHLFWEVFFDKKTLAEFKEFVKGL
jgi:calcineurin-like phosphoesterase family protein